MNLVQDGYSLRDWIGMWVATFLPWRVVYWCTVRWESRRVTITTTGRKPVLGDPFERWPR